MSGQCLLVTEDMITTLLSWQRGIQLSSLNYRFYRIFDKVASTIILTRLGIQPCTSQKDANALPRGYGIVILIYRISTHIHIHTIQYQYFLNLRLIYPMK